MIVIKCYFFMYLICVLQICRYPCRHNHHGFVEVEKMVESKCKAISLNKINHLLHLQKYFQVHQNHCGPLQTKLHTCIGLIKVLYLLYINIALSHMWID